AIEAVDAATKTVVEAALERGYGVSIIADHGNADKMRNPDGTPHTAHTTALVPHLIIKGGFSGPSKNGQLGDIAPTILALLDEDIPDEMTGDVLVNVPQPTESYSNRAAVPEPRQQTRRPSAKRGPARAWRVRQVRSWTASTPSRLARSSATSGVR